MRMTGFLCAGVLLLAAWTGSGCAGQTELDPFFKPGKEDILSENELAALTWHARQFIAASKHVRLKPDARKFVRDTEPSVHIRYLAHKYGKIHMLWFLTPQTRLILSGVGPLTRKEFPWNLEINTTAASHPVPPGFLKDGENSPVLPRRGGGTRSLK